MLDFLMRHQTDVMLALSSIGAMILLLFEMFSYIYKGDMS